MIINEKFSLVSLISKGSYKVSLLRFFTVLLKKNLENTQKKQSLSIHEKPSMGDKIDVLNALHQLKLTSNTHFEGVLRKKANH